MRLPLDRLQPLGRALMLPIAVLPVAALLLRLGQPDLLGLPFVAAAGGAIFSNLGILFAIGVAVGLARENHGAAGLAGAVAYFVAIEGAKALMTVPAEAIDGFAGKVAQDLASSAWKARELGKLSVPCGILSGLVSGWLYNRYATIKVPEYLAFFGGRRFVPIAAGFAGIGGALIFGLGFPVLETAIDGLSHWVVEAGSVGLFLYGALNRLLIVTGLHHILNNIAWFILGDFHGATGDLNRFFAGDPAAGAFMSGFFPIMMFGLPAACFAIYRTALPERRKAVGGQLLSLALTSFLTGVTEPIEFAFMFLAPLLYAVHAALTGLSMVIMDALGVRLGFGFSAGLFDYLLNFGLATQPWLLLPIGAAYSALYYAVFRFCIVRFDLKTPGRETASPAFPVKSAVAGNRADGLVAALGGAANIKTVDACTTRLRLELVDNKATDDLALKELGARGIVRPGPGKLQVVLGPIADHVAGEIRQRLAEGKAAAPSIDDSIHAVLRALGGADNIGDWHVRAGRLSVTIKDPALGDPGSLAKAAPRGAIFLSPSRAHLLVGPLSEPFVACLSALCGHAVKQA
ncbi:PTS N-acetyl-D-glucosamine transporter [Sphingomonas oleivorans]|uniref:PTS N-acetyl-D-glucosamine transporter n=1 Tax=Sphingomonas oleivorans TaxID=1735121 RepID=A0A2T5FU61_9SPHN|nr:N-acetylglucosamine-specific PTS transporter subunit IIBC [Sphingomonas oleivorans]PTQ07820.1 PTS N-acetyl-D-glucosamine transporter [Sphingomonas oleivorans]